MLIQKVWNIKITTVFKTDAILNYQWLYKTYGILSYQRLYKTYAILSYQRLYKTYAILSYQRLYKMHVTNRSNVDVTHANACRHHWSDTQHGISTL